MGIELCVPSWSLRTAFVNRELDLVKVAERVNELGVEYIDIFDSHFHPEKDLMEIENPLNHAEMLRKQFDDIGVKVTGVSAANDLSMEKATVSDVARLSRWIDICPALGAEFVRINTGRHWMEWKDGDVNFAVDKLRQNLEPLLTSARNNQVTLVLENHPLDIPVWELGQQYIQSMRRVIELAPEVLAICADDGHIEWNTPEEWKQSFRELLSRGPLLFSIDLVFQSDLDHDNGISEDLRRGFENNGILLSQNATISIEEKDSRWLITDKDNEQTFLIRKEEGKLNIYKELLYEAKYMHVKCGRYAFRKEKWPVTWKERVSLWHEKNYNSFVVMEYVDTGDAWAELRKVINIIVEVL